MSAPSLAVAMLASTKPRWLRHITRDPVALGDAEVGERPGQRVGAAVHLAERQRAELVDDRGPVRVEPRGAVKPPAGPAPQSLQRLARPGPARPGGTAG